MSPPSKAENFPALFRILADNSRLHLLALLRKSELSVGELQRIFRIGQSTLSSQLGQLRDHGLVEARKEGQKVFYRLKATRDDPSYQGILTPILDAFTATDAFQRDAERLEMVLQDRAETNRNFFDSLKDTDLVAPGQNGDTLALGLAHLLTGRRLVDLGCGSGRITTLLHLAGKEVVGVDHSEERLRTARALAERNGGTGLPPPRFIQAPMEATGLPAETADLVIISQALHHAADPGAVIRESFRLLAGGGALLVLDLLTHQEEWMREKYGDFWLGFQPGALELWLRESGFRESRVSTAHLHSALSEPPTLVAWALK